MERHGDGVASKLKMTYSRGNDGNEEFCYVFACSSEQLIEEQAKSGIFFAWVEITFFKEYKRFKKYILTISFET